MSRYGKIFIKIKKRLKKLWKKEGRIVIAKNLLDILDIETIAAKTGLSIEQVKLISKNEL